MEELIMTTSTTKKDLRVLKGKAHKTFSYFITVQDFMNSSTYKIKKNLAFIASILLMFLGAVLPLIIGFFTSFDSWNTAFYEINLISNSIMAIPFCLPLSLACIFGAVPLYKKLVDRIFVKYGFIKRITTIKRVA